MSTKGPSDSSQSWQNKTQVIQGGPKWRPTAESGGDCLVIIYSKESANLGKRFVLDPAVGGMTIGRGADNAIVLESDSVSRKHARFEQKDDGWWVTDLRSTNGTYVNDEQVSEHKLRRADHIKVGDTIFKYLAGSDVEAAYHEEIYRMTIVDGLTQAHNKRFLFEQLDKEISRARRYVRPLALIMFDLDHFKKINDTFGHIAGDYVLRECSALVRGRIRRDEVFARYGGEEFALLLPETDGPGALKLAEEIRTLIMQHNFTFEHERIALTVSIGLAQLTDNLRSPEAFIELADRKLYEAKHGGRNRVAV
jgi:two-component system cell cycle response regulator